MIITDNVVSYALVGVPIADENQKHNKKQVGEKGASCGLQFHSTVVIKGSKDRNSDRAGTLLESGVHKEAMEGGG